MAVLTLLMLDARSNASISTPKFETLRHRTKALDVNLRLAMLYTLDTLWGPGSDAAAVAKLSLSKKVEFPPAFNFPYFNLALGPFDTFRRELQSEIRLLQVLAQLDNRLSDARFQPLIYCNYYLKSDNHNIAG